VAGFDDDAKAAGPDARPNNRPAMSPRHLDIGIGDGRFHLTVRDAVEAHPALGVWAEANHRAVHRPRITRIGAPFPPPFTSRAVVSLVTITCPIIIVPRSPPAQRRLTLAFG
jgi:hypothetical protein